MQSIKKSMSVDKITCLEERFSRDKNTRNYNNYTNNTIISNIPKDNIDYYIVKPMGKKCYLWFTYIDKQFISLIKFPNDNDFFIADINFDNTLSYNNVLLYGYYVKIEEGYFFILDNIVNYNDYNYILSNKNYCLSSVFKIYSRLLDNIDVKSRFQVFLPFICDNYNAVFTSIYNLAYRPYGISLWKKDKNLGIYTFNNTNNIWEGIFKIKANINHDTYDLYCANGNHLDFHNRSLITDYKLSVYMNSLFRNIVENKNLDRLEESEDEDSFENIDENKFVDLNKSYYFKCCYNRRFKKWVPKCIIENGKLADLITKKQLIYIEKK